MNGQKTGGRQKGTPNKVTTEVREFLASLVSDNFDLIQQDFRNMTTEQRMTFLPKILPYIVPKQKPVSEEEERKQASLDLKSIGKTAQALMFWEQQQEKEERESSKAAAEEAAERAIAEEEESEMPITEAQERAKATAEAVMPSNEREEVETPQPVDRAARPAQARPVTAASRKYDEPASPTTQNQQQPQQEKQYTVTDEEYNEFMSLLCKDLEPYLQYNSLDEVDFEAIQRQKAAAAAQSNSSNQTSTSAPSD